MGSRISRRTRNELVEALRQRYARSNKKEKTRILDEFVTVAGCHRKYAVRLLGKDNDATAHPPESGVGRRIYDEAVKEALVVAWEATDRICGKRLKAILPSLVDAMERHGHLHLEPSVRDRVLSVSAATIDRLLAPVRSTVRRRKKRRTPTKPSRQVPVRTFADWSEPAPGFMEIDFVAHGGGSMAGSFIHSLVATDVCSGWTECVPLLAREQSLVVQGLEVIGQWLPVPMLGIDSDNDGAFINDTLVTYCERRDLEFTRSRAYKKNDQAWIEQKNGAVVRRFVGYERYSGPVAGQTLASLYGALRLYVNYFQPSFKLVEKRRNGARVTKRYDKPATPCDRLLRHDAIDAGVKEALRRQRARLDPIELLHRIREAQAALSSLASSELGPSQEKVSLEKFLAQLPRLWHLGEVRPTHRGKTSRPRDWRTREDPFEGVWPRILIWLQQDPDATAKSLFQRLREQHPGRFSEGQIRTLQRRVKQWRRVMAKKLVYACLDGQEAKMATLVGQDFGTAIR
ncbi:MAG: transposase family protein [Phycisphaerae bacterium]